MYSVIYSYFVKTQEIITHNFFVFCFVCTALLLTSHETSCIQNGFLSSTTKKQRTEEIGIKERWMIIHSWVPHLRIKIFFIFVSFSFFFYSSFDIFIFIFIMYGKSDDFKKNYYYFLVSLTGLQLFVHGIFVAACAFDGIDL